jgi:ribose transport system permease protein
MKIKFGDYGMVLVLLALVLLFSLLTLKRKDDNGPSAALDLVEQVQKDVPEGQTVLIFGATNTPYQGVAEGVAKGLTKEGRGNFQLVIGVPRDLRVALNELRGAGGQLGAIATSGERANEIIQEIPNNYPEFKNYKVLRPSTSLYSTFFQTRNFLAISKRVVVIAIVAIGMTLVIITAGIDLSVGSLVGLSAMVGAGMVQTNVVRALEAGGSANDVGGGAVLFGFLIAILCCAAIGFTCGSVIAVFKVAPFIVTLGVMMIARGLAKMSTDIDHNLPLSFDWLSHGKILGIPNTILLLMFLYLGAHIFMSRTKYGRYIYAVGGNAEASRLSGVPVTGVLVFVYTICGVLCGLGGCVQASQIGDATKTIGISLELEVIAAVVVGGTSLFGGTGRIFGTLIGALVISVMKNGMNQLNFEDALQDVVLGAIIIIAVLIDKLRQRGGLRKVLAEPY